MRLISKIKLSLFVSVCRLNIWYLRNIVGVNIGKNCIISRKARLDKINPEGIHIGNNVRILAWATILSHDYCRSLLKPEISHSQLHIDNSSIIGIHAVIMPGVHIGEQCIVAAGAIVTKDIPDRCIVAGNPAKIIRRNIHINAYGQIVDYGDKFAE